MLLICGYKVLSISEVTNWDLIHVVFHCPENASRYNQVFEMNLF